MENAIRRIFFRKLVEMYEKIWRTYLDVHAQSYAAQRMLEYSTKLSEDGKTVTMRKEVYEVVMDSLDKTSKKSKELGDLLIDIKRDL